MLRGLAGLTEAIKTMHGDFESVLAGMQIELEEVRRAVVKYGS